MIDTTPCPVCSARKGDGCATVGNYHKWPPHDRRIILHEKNGDAKKFIDELANVSQRTSKAVFDSHSPSAPKNGW